mgnify:CR=1 FL=1
MLFWNFYQKTIGVLQLMIRLYQSLGLMPRVIHLTSHWLLSPCIIDFFCFFVCFGFMVTLERDFFTVMETSSLPVKGCNFFFLKTSLGTQGLEQWGVFCVLHIMWHGPSVYNGHRVISFHKSSLFSNLFFDISKFVT